MAGLMDSKFPSAGVDTLVEKPECVGSTTNNLIEIEITSLVQSDVTTSNYGVPADQTKLKHNQKRISVHRDSSYSYWNTNCYKRLMIHLKQPKTKVVLAISAVVLIIGIIPALVTNKSTPNDNDEKFVVQPGDITTKVKNFTTDNKMKILQSSPQNDGDKITELEISSLRDLNQITSTSTSIRIKAWMMTEAEYKLQHYNSSKILGSEHVRNLEVLGSLPEYILIHLLRRFTNLERLRLNMDEMCNGAEELNRSNLPILNLPSLKFLSIEESRICLLIKWVLRWKAPKLEKFHIFQADISEEVFKVMTGFLGSAQNSLREISIEKCYICQECHFDQFSFLDDILLKISHKYNSYLNW